MVGGVVCVIGFVVMMLYMFVGIVEVEVVISFLMLHFFRRDLDEW